MLLLLGLFRCCRFVLGVLFGFVVAVIFFYLVCYCSCCYDRHHPLDLGFCCCEEKHLLIKGNKCVLLEEILTVAFCRFEYDPICKRPGTNEIIKQTQQQ